MFGRRQIRVRGRSTFPRVRFTIWPDPRQPWAQVLAVAQQAQAAGWHALRFGDDTGGALQGAEPPLECWATLGAIAAAVPRLRLEAVVSDHRRRHPAVVAKQAVTTDLLSGGRIVLGLLAGGAPQAHEVLEEACQVVQQLVAADRATFDGRYYHLRDAPLEPKPRQRPLPLLTWGDGSDASAALAARHAQQWSVSGSPAEVQEQVGKLRRACHDVGRQPGEITVSASAELVGRPEMWIPALLEYAGSGVEEWVVADRALGADHRQRLAAMVNVMAEVAPAIRLRRGCDSPH
jgi:alkanesulfonate monooxygenase SsuD/methylene tetrahydromethanopterin reductase-like flavin-dependent oxidoreductase (luciferase family)